MLEEQKPQFYTLSEPSSETVQVRSLDKRVILKVAMIIFLVLGVLGTGLLVNSISKNRLESKEAALSRAKSLQMAAEQSCEAGDVDCLERAQSDAARAVGEEKACTDLPEEELVKCISLIAFDKVDVGLCDQLRTEYRDSCKDAVYPLLAVQQKDFKMCAKIKGEISKLSCEAKLTEIAVKSDNCGMYGVSEEYCDSDNKISLIVAALDPEGCNDLVASDRDSCLDIFYSVDDDLDGLNLAEEWEAGTDPKKNDTDDDGYNDGVEVSAGYDPLKP